MSGIEQQEPGPLVAADDGLNALAIEPARGFDGLSAPPIAVMCVSIDAAHAMRDRGHDAGKARALRGEDDRGVRRAAKSFARRGVGGKARLREGLALDGEQSRCQRQQLRCRARGVLRRRCRWSAPRRGAQPAPCPR